MPKSEGDAGDGPLRKAQQAMVASYIRTAFAQETEAAAPLTRQANGWMCGRSLYDARLRFRASWSL
jgi:hypothetical protein